MAKLKNSDLSKIKSLANKLNNLYEKGDKNEKDVAKSKLDSLLKKYSIKSYNDLNVYKREFKLADWNDCLIIMTHCILDTVNIEIEGDKKAKCLYCNLTDSQYIEVCEKFNHYYPMFVNQRDNFIKAFLLANDLGIIDADDKDVSDFDINGIAEVSKIVKSKKLIKNDRLIDFN